MSKASKNLLLISLLFYQHHFFKRLRLQFLHLERETVKLLSFFPSDLSLKHSFIHWFIRGAAIRQKIKLKERGCQYRHRVSFPNLIHFCCRLLNCIPVGEENGVGLWTGWYRGWKDWDMGVVSYTGGRRCLLTAAVRTCQLYNALWNSLSHWFSPQLWNESPRVILCFKIQYTYNNNKLDIEKDQSRTLTGRMHTHICKIYQINGFTNLNHTYEW